MSRLLAIVIFGSRLQKGVLNIHYDCLVTLFIVLLCSGNFERAATRQKRNPYIVFSICDIISFSLD
jgi:hypothetical protein